MKTVGGLKSKETPKVIIVCYALYIWSPMLGEPSSTAPLNIMILSSSFILIIALAGLVFIYKQRKVR